MRETRSQIGDARQKDRIGLVRHSSRLVAVIFLAWVWIIFLVLMSARHRQAVASRRSQAQPTGETDLIGQPGLETSYRLKQVVQPIKQAALDCFQDEPELLSMIRRAMASEAETVARRFSAKTA